MPIPVIDLFAGPGGLGEGFSSISDPISKRRLFEIGVSVEKDPVAHRTLTLRAFFRAFGDGAAPDAYYDYVQGVISHEQLFSDKRFAEEATRATQEAICAELGAVNPKEIDTLIRTAIGSAEHWVLIGGPPCQAYSLVGRSRVRGVDPEKHASDPRHLLYKEYLRVIRTHNPAIFVMENVKGILSSMHAGAPIFERILEDLSQPAPGIAYDIRSFVVPCDGTTHNPDDFIIRSELFGVPQARHRVILLGVRSDLTQFTHRSLKVDQDPSSVRSVLMELPKIRSRLSRECDSHRAWLSAIGETSRRLRGWRHEKRANIELHMSAAADMARAWDSSGGAFVSSAPHKAHSSELRDWLSDSRLPGVSQHQSRSHMRTDIHRYFFASAYAHEVGVAPKLGDFPELLQPAHANAAAEAAPFQDRFRVQLWDYPSSTVVSHIAKDGHYFIHPDTSQCRSLTVREAARLQTFPDNYFFEGNRTQQYTQVGNAVPPFLARQLAEIVGDLVYQASSKSGQYAA